MYYDAGLQLPELFGGDVHLGPSHIVGAEQDLAVDVSEIHRVVIDHRDFANTGGS